ncbi:MAG: proton-conducting membrane transporter [Ruminococcaceae bacterium]|nr:proton-conducting membrane transporter [Oscillospiraceae bacterium]
MNCLIVFTVMLPVIAGAILRLSNVTDRVQVHNYSDIVLGLNLIITIAFNLSSHNQGCTLIKLPMGLSISFTADWVAIFFSTIFAIIWFLVGIYSREYLKHEGNHQRFMSYYLIALGAISGVSYASNPFTFYTFFELMSLTSFVLVLHSHTPESISAAKKYIYYSIFGALCGLIAIMAFYGSDLIAVKEFVAGGSLVRELGGRMPMVMVVTFIAILGFSCKAGMFPMHSWLPVAHPEAPSPASAVLSGLIAKTGIVAIIRIVFFVVGADVLRGSWVQFVFLVLSITTIFMGSMMAYKEKLLKRRLAYSSVSQISYAMFGVMMLSTAGIKGAFLQIVFHAFAKSALFLCAGIIINKTERKYVDQLTGLGNVMPFTFAFFTIAAMSLVGVPLTGGYESKYYLAQSALSGNFGVIEFIGFVVIMVSALLTGGYLLSISAKALFANRDQLVCEKCEGEATMLVPVGILIAMVLGFGICPTFISNIVTEIVAHLGM